MLTPEAFGKVIEKEPQNADAYYNRCRAIYEHRGTYMHDGLDMQDYRKAVELNPGAEGTLYKQPHPKAF